MSTSDASVEQPVITDPAFEVSASSISIESTPGAEPLVEASTSDAWVEQPASAEPILDASELELSPEPSPADVTNWANDSAYSVETNLSAGQSFEVSASAEVAVEASANAVDAPFEFEDQGVEVSASDVTEVAEGHEEPALELTASDVVVEPSPFEQPPFEFSGYTNAEVIDPEDVVFDPARAAHQEVELLASDELVETSPVTPPELPRALEPYPGHYEQPAQSHRSAEFTFDPPQYDASLPEFETGTLAELTHGSGHQAGGPAVEHAAHEGEPIQLASNAEFLDAPQLASTGAQWSGYDAYQPASSEGWEPEQAPAWSEQPVVSEWDHASALQQSAQYQPEHAEEPWPPPQQSWAPVADEAPPAPTFAAEAWGVPAPAHPSAASVPTLAAVAPPTAPGIPHVPMAGPGAIHASQLTASPRVSAHLAEAAQWAPAQTSELFGAPGLELTEPAGPGPTWIDGEHRVIIHTIEGQVKRGTIRDIDLLDQAVHLEQQTGFAPERIPVSRLKAVFFMLPAGSRPPTASGQKLRVTFNDGRQVAGFCSDYSSNAPGFFVVPADNRTNTARIFIYRSSVQSVIEG